MHRYRARVTWSGSTGAGYGNYDRTHRCTIFDAAGTPLTIADRLSSDPAFLGDPSLPNPEQLLVLAAASCQLLSFLAVAARARIDAVGYADEAQGVMPEGSSPTGLTRITLQPHITVRGVQAAGSIRGRLERLVEIAHNECYIANSLKTQVHIDPCFELI